MLHLWITFAQKATVGTIFGPYDCPKANAHKQDVEVVQQRAIQYTIVKANTYALYIVSIAHCILQFTETGARTALFFHVRRVCWWFFSVTWICQLTTTSDPTDHSVFLTGLLFFRWHIWGNGHEIWTFFLKMFLKWKTKTVQYIN